MKVWLIVDEEATNQVGHYCETREEALQDRAGREVEELILPRPSAKLVLAALNQAGFCRSRRTIAEREDDPE